MSIDTMREQSKMDNDIILGFTEELKTDKELVGINNHIWNKSIDELQKTEREFQDFEKIPSWIIELISLKENNPDQYSSHTILDMLLIQSK